MELINVFYFFIKLIMNVNIFFSVALTLCFLVFGVSCSKDETGVPEKSGTENQNPDGSSEDGKISISVTAIPGFGDAWSRADIGDDGSKPSIEWKIEDVIYIGSIDETVEDNTSLRTLIDNGMFSTFTCSEVNEDGTAVFNGDKIPENANMAVYTGHPEYVIKSVITEGENKHIVLKTSAITSIPKGDDNFSHLSENDLLVAGFDSESKSLVLGSGNYSNQAFSRVFALGKFVLTLPPTTSGILGELISMKAESDSEAQLTCNAAVMPYNLNSTTGLASVKESDGVYVVDCSNLSLVDNGTNKTVTFYSLIGQQELSGKTLKFSLNIGGVTYNSTLQASVDISSPNMAILFNLAFEGKAEEVEGNNSYIQDFADWKEWN